MGSARSRLLAVAAAATVVAASCSSSSGSGQIGAFRHFAGSAPSPGASSSTSSVPASGASFPGAPVAPVHWVACQGSAGPSGYQCATIQVPRNPENPSVGGTIGLALDRRPASGTKYGSLLINPGGPGGSGVDFLPQAVSFLDPSLLEHFDVVGFDPPGVDRTAPIVCADGPQLDQYYAANPDPTTPAGLAAYLALDRTFAAGCEARSGAELPYVSTVDAAMDMDVIRADLGDAKLTYLGFSYGTFLGATYANLFPQRVRAMVLDGALDPSLPVIASLEQQSAGFDQDLRDALTACATKPSCPWKFTGDPVAAYRALLAKVSASPVPVSGSSRTVGAAAFLYGTALTLYDTSYWTYLYQALAGVQAGDGTFMLELFDNYTGRNANGTYSNELEANAAVNCLDDPAPSVAAVEAAAVEVAQTAPVFGPSDVLSELQCDVWPVPATGRVEPIHADGSPPIVVVGSTGDPATPYADAQALASQLQHGVLLTRVGDGHTGYQFSSCIRGYVDSYLIDLTVPPAGIRCPSN
jgi:pimeloyl-ACP methyl ester carboxylesterase